VVVEEKRDKKALVFVAPAEAARKQKVFFARRGGFDAADGR
jgi:hypothetical protein